MARQVGRGAVGRSFVRPLGIGTEGHLFVVVSVRFALLLCVKLPWKMVAVRVRVLYALFVHVLFSSSVCSAAFLYAA